MTPPTKRREGKSLSEKERSAENGNTIKTNPNIAIARNLRTGRWRCARTPIAKSNGSICNASMRRSCRTSGTAGIADRSLSRWQPSPPKKNIDFVVLMI